MALWLDQNQYRADHAALRGCSHDIETDSLRVLQQFPVHSLEAQAEVDLPDRTDSKYLLPVGLLPRLLAGLMAEHTVLQSAGHRIFTYENTYFDTPCWDLYLRHHNGNLNRHKCRLRRYHETDTAYLEIKLKNNKLRTIKNRIPWLAKGPAAALPGEEPLQASLYVNYRRITLWNRASNERLTLDFDIHYRRPGKHNTVRLPQLLVAELKRVGKVYGSMFVRRAKGYGFTPQSFSKYCVGVCLTDNGELKTNRFKPILRRLDIDNNNGGP